MNLVLSMMAMRLGVRVRAPGDIFYAHTGVTIEQGREGVVQVVTHCGALVGVQWDADEKVARATAFNALEVL